MKAPQYELPYLNEDRTFSLDEVLGEKVVVLTFGYLGAQTVHVIFRKKNNFIKRREVMN